jgi:hypothetical protein
MKFLSILVLFIASSSALPALAQSAKAQIDHIAPYPKAVPGQIMEVRVQGIGESPMARVATTKVQSNSAFKTEARRDTVKLLLPRLNCLINDFCLLCATKRQSSLEAVSTTSRLRVGAKLRNQSSPLASHPPATASWY